jgi:c-di-GMP-binding flagellar brake protein YcgR
VDVVRVLETVIEVRVMSNLSSYATSLDDIIDDRTFTIAAPPKNEFNEAILVGDKLRLTCVTERGLYMFDTEVINTYMRNSVPILELRITSEMKKVQRREAFRAKESVDVSIRLLMSEGETVSRWFNTRTIDISETGALIRYPEMCAEDTNLEIVIKLHNQGLNEVLPKIKGKVVRCTAAYNNQGYFLGVRFYDVPEKAKNVLLKLVVLSQRSKLIYNTKRKN